MKTARLPAFAVALLLAAQAGAQQFTTFPDRAESRSPDGRLRIYSADHVAGPTEFSGVFRWLVLEEVASRCSRVLYSYTGRAAVAWSGHFIIVSDYASKRTSRAMIFAFNPQLDDLHADPLALGEITLDKVQLARLLPSEQNIHLLENDHVYVEATRVDGDALLLRVWGYGARDSKGFRWSCQYDLRAGRASCAEKTGGGPPH